MTFCYIHRSGALLNHHQKRFVLQQMGKIRRLQARQNTEILKHLALNGIVLSNSSLLGLENLKEETEIVQDLERWNTSR